MRSLVERMIFFPSPGVDLLPEQLGLEGEQVFLESGEGVRIHAFWLPAPGAKDSRPRRLRGDRGTGRLARPARHGRSPTCRGAAV